MIVAHNLWNVSFLSLLEFQAVILSPPALLIFSLSSWISLRHLWKWNPYDEIKRHLFQIFLLTFLGLLLLAQWLMSSNLTLVAMFKQYGIVLVLVGLAVGIYLLRAQMAEKEYGSSYRAILQDRVERKRAETLFVEDQGPLRTLLDALPEYIFVKDCKSRFVLNNLAHIKELGASSQEELIGKTDFDIFPESLAYQYYTAEQQILQTRQPMINHEEMTIDPDGNPHWLLTSKVPLHDKHGQVIGLVGTSRDITKRKQDEEKLHELCQAVETMQLGVTITDLKGTIIYTNPAEARMHGYPVEELLGKDLGIFAPVGFRRPMTIEQINSMKHLRQSINIKKDGSIFPVRLMSDVIRDVSGKPAAIITTCEDISVYRRTAEKLRQHTRELFLLNKLSDKLQLCEQEEETYHIIVDICKKLFPAESGCLCIQHPATNAMNVVAYWDEQGQEVLSEHWSTELLSRWILEKSSTFCPRQRYASHAECLSVPIVASGEILGLISICLVQEAANNTKQEVETKRIALNRVAKHYALALANLRLREKLRIESIQDPLTGLYNRRYMEESLKREAFRAKRHGSQVGIIMLDVDHFKSFNDLHGHHIGDSVLHELGEFLHTRIRGEDIACRYGGEEFLLILPEASLETARQRAEELRVELQNLKIMAQGKQFHIAISLGVAAFPNHHSDIMQTVDAADMALYRAKALGRNQVAVAT
ncbi:PAS fold family [Candidatus Vecturithrix granuli]|uniref:PAS fold family n=1 Tax=Vecturithrix granuli TaxID=1499967 RepID=A0A081C6Y7_VECG1|nr:PAS fold family [Candidatus Vecturithrix granuli]